jgi:hypothetical protein
METCGKHDSLAIARARSLAALAAASGSGAYPRAVSLPSALVTEAGLKQRAAVAVILHEAFFDRYVRRTLCP